MGGIGPGHLSEAILAKIRAHAKGQHELHCEACMRAARIVELRLGLPTWHPLRDFSCPTHELSAEELAEMARIRTAALERGGFYDTHVGELSYEREVQDGMLIDDIINKWRDGRV